MQRLSPDLFGEIYTSTAGALVDPAIIRDEAQTLIELVELIEGDTTVPATYYLHPTIARFIAQHSTLTVEQVQELDAESRDFLVRAITEPALS